MSGVVQSELKGNNWQATVHVDFGDARAGGSTGLGYCLAVASTPDISQGPSVDSPQFLGLPELVESVDDVDGLHPLRSSPRAPFAPDYSTDCVAGVH